jgi:hypothetical protein
MDAGQLAAGRNDGDVIEGKGAGCDDADRRHNLPRGWHTGDR